MADCRQRRGERLALIRDRRAAGNMGVAALRAKPCREFRDQRSAFAAMGVNVLARDVGDIALEPIALAVEDDAGFQAMLWAAVFPGAQEQAKFERHVEARKGRVSIDFGPRDVVNAITAFPNDLTDFVETIVRRIIPLKRATRHESGADDRKNGGVEKDLISVIEGAINEDMAAPVRHLATFRPGPDGEACRRIPAEFLNRRPDFSRSEMFRLALWREDCNAIG
jgi:hypothetical protein